jgi:hypothetical protein
MIITGNRFDALIETKEQKSVDRGKEEKSRKDAVKDPQCRKKAKPCEDITKEQPTKEQPTKGQPTKEQPTKEQPTKEQPTKEQPTKRQPTKGQPTKGQPTKGQPTKGQPTKGQPTKEQPTKEQPTKEQPTKEQPTKGQPTETADSGKDGIKAKGRKKWKPGDLILNLSSKILTAYEISVLSLGIKFCPYPTKINMFNYLKDMASFSRRMRLKEFFVDAQPSEKPPEWMKKTKGSSFTPPKHRDAHLDSYLDLINAETIKLLKIDSDSNWENMSPSQREALEKLKQDKSIIIKPADKGGALTIIDRVVYEKAILGMLQDEKFLPRNRQGSQPQISGKYTGICFKDAKGGPPE